MATASKKPVAAKGDKKVAAKPEAPKMAKVEKPEVKQPPILKVSAPRGKQSTLHVLSETARPASGALLFAHTHAAFSFLGMLTSDRADANRSAVETIVGKRATAYHLRQKNIEATKEGKIRLTSAGLKTFMSRLTEGKVGTPHVNAFLTLFQKGTPQPDVGVKQTSIVAVPIQV